MTYRLLILRIHIIGISDVERALDALRPLFPSKGVEYEALPSAMAGIITVRDRIFYVTLAGVYRRVARTLVDAGLRPFQVVIESWDGVRPDSRLDCTVSQSVEATEVNEQRTSYDAGTPTDPEADPDPTLQLCDDTPAPSAPRATGGHLRARQVPLFECQAQCCGTPPGQLSHASADYDTDSFHQDARKRRIHATGDETRDRPYDDDDVLYGHGRQFYATPRVGFDAFGNALADERILVTDLRCRRCNGPVAYIGPGERTYASDQDEAAWTAYWNDPSESGPQLGDSRRYEDEDEIPF